MRRSVALGHLLKALTLPCRDRLSSAVNAWRAQNGRTPIPASQIDTNEFKSFGIRVSKRFSVGVVRTIEVLAQVFNLFGTDNLGGPGQGWVENALSDSFDRINSMYPR